MRLLHLVSLCLLAIPGCDFARAAVPGPSTILGVVRDGEGKPLAGVAVRLNGLPAVQKTSSNEAGEYRFEGLAAGDYTLAAELNGYAAMSAPVIHLQATANPFHVDLTLTSLTAASAPNTTPPTKPKLQFEASGIHGLIDPGGYSASASADAATGLLRGMADVKRAGAGFALPTAKDWPCDLEPKLRDAVAEHPDQDESNRMLGQFYAAHDQPDKAIPLLRRALQIDSADNDASRDLGVAWLERGQFEEAFKLLSALAGRDDVAEVHRLLARAEEGSGKFQPAAQEYRTAEREQPSEESFFGAGYESILAGSPAQAIPDFQTGIEKYPKSITLWIGLGTAQFLLGNSSAAVHSFLEASEVDPANPRPYPFLAAASGISAEEKDRVRSSFKRYFDLAGDSAQANYLYALVLSRANAEADTTRIEMLLKRAIQLDPSLAKAHLQLADMDAQRTDYQDAVPEYEAAIRLAPEIGEAHYRLAMALKRSGRTEESAREMEAFKRTRAKPESGPGNDEINIAQFISVMGTQTQHSGSEAQCVEPPR